MKNVIAPKIFPRTYRIEMGPDSFKQKKELRKSEIKCRRYAISMMTYYLPTFEDLETGVALSYSERYELTENGIAPEYIETYMHNLPRQDNVQSLRPMDHIVACLDRSYCLNTSSETLSSRNDDDTSEGFWELESQSSQQKHEKYLTPHIPSPSKIPIEVHQPEQWNQPIPLHNSVPYIRYSIPPPGYTPNLRPPMPQYYQPTINYKPSPIPNINKPIPMMPYYFNNNMTNSGGLSSNTLSDISLNSSFSSLSINAPELRPRPQHTECLDPLEKDVALKLLEVDPLLALQFVQQCKQKKAFSTPIRPPPGFGYPEPRM